MKKLYSSTVETSNNDNCDHTRKLYKTIFDGIHYLDSEQAYAKSGCDLFSRLLVTQRMKVREHCERLMFLDPLGHGRKAEELLWRKGYYEPFAFSKRIRAGSVWNPVERAFLQAHLLSGVGHYQNIILRLQVEFNIDLRGVLDFPLLVCDEGLPKRSTLIGKKSLIKNNNFTTAMTLAKKRTHDQSGTLDWANHAVYRCLLYLGDLSRYLVDISPNWDAGLAARCYYQALCLKPEAGMPHNQLGLLSGSKNYNLDAVYHYMRCMCAVESFEGTEGNLTSVLARNASSLESERCGGDGPLVKHCIMEFLYIAGLLFSDRTPRESMAALVDRWLKLLEECREEELLRPMMKEPDSLDDAVLSVEKQPDFLKDELLFKIFVILLMCIQRSIEKGFDRTGPEALCLSLTSVIVQTCANKFTENVPLPKPKKTVSNDQKLHSRRRRRRVRNNSFASEESDPESERVEIISSNSSESEEELIFDENSSSQSDNEDGKTGTNRIVASNGECMNGGKELLKHQKQMNGRTYMNGSAKGSEVMQTSRMFSNPVFKFVQELSKSGYLLQTVKVCCDWLSCNMHILSSCVESSRPLVSNLITLFNFLLQIPGGEVDPRSGESVFESSLKDDDFSLIPLEEDVELCNLSILKLAHSGINLDYVRLHDFDCDTQTRVRVFQILHFGRKLAGVKEVCVEFNEAKRWFAVGNQTTISSQAHNDGLARGKMMQNMGKAWLRAEVRNLESKTERNAPLPPYLIVDCDALVNFSPLVKQFVNSKKFIVLVPSVVVQMLDKLKCSSGKVRDMIRWMEAQLKNGDRFLQAQLSHQQESIPCIKYPKKKDKEAWAFFQILECCYFLTKQSSKDASNLVTLVTGSNLSSCNFNPINIAKSAGVNVEHIGTFHGKWKNSCKSHG